MSRKSSNKNIKEEVTATYVGAVIASGVVRWLKDRSRHDGHIT